jgi:hypothetical protein
MSHGGSKDPRYNAIYRGATQLKFAASSLLP